MNKNMPQLREKSMSLPLLPGVYIMKNKNDEIIYIGKAKNLKNRVSQYFGSQNRHALKVLKMVENVDHFDYIVTGSEFEALVLECSLIKQHMPKYNILLKDDKGYSYIKISGEEYKTISAVLQKDDDNAEYIGPYTSSYAVKQSVDTANKVFKLPQCSKKFPRDFKKGRPCLNYYISQCCGLCTGKINKAEYCETVEEAIGFLKGDSKTTVSKLREKMNMASENLEFEKAAKLRDKINAIEKIKEKQKVVYQNIEEQDVFGIAELNNNACLAVLRFSENRLFDSEHFFFEKNDELSAMRFELITSYYSLRNKVPKRVTLDGEIDDLELLEKWLTEKRGKKVTVSFPKRGEQVEVVNMCVQNATEKLALKEGKQAEKLQCLKNSKTYCHLKTRHHI
ncbi:MAG: excinuclease ABC subunit UvrC [Oscillospiraceae bacterium]